MKNRWSSVGLLLLAFVSGVALYQTFIYVVGYLAAIRIPEAYFAWFGGPHVGLALAVANLATVGVPTVALFMAGTFASYKLLHAPPLGPFMLSLVAGVFACFVYWTVSAVFFPPELPPEIEPYPPSVILKQILLPAWFHVPNTLAPWLGLAFAGWLLTRRSRVEA